MIHIRTATINDAEVIADMSRKCFYDTYAAHNTKADMDIFMSEQFNKTRLIKEVGAEGNTFLLAYANDELAGYVFLKNQQHAVIPAENTIEIARLYARHSFIGKGIGKALMQATVAQAIAENKIFIWLGVWEHNPHAIKFYTSFGFEKFAEQDFILGKDVQRDWVMGLKVRS